MSEQKDQTSYYQGEPYGRDKDEECQPPPPPPPPPPCPDPCDDDPPWGPPHIRPECCPDDRQCCPEDERGYCTWDEATDPCVRASSCGGDWTKIDCKCHSSNEQCNCEEWDCGCYPQGGCVPCKPCEGLLPEGDPTGGCDDPGRDDCTAADLRKQLDALQHCISSQEGEKAKIEADITARKQRETDLKTLVGTFDGIVEKYKNERQKLICSEDCLKGFYRDMTRVFHDKYKFPDGCLQKLQDAINVELCRLEREKCCQKNLEGKLTKVTRLIWEQQQADANLAKAQDAFTILQDLAKWIGDQFTDLDNLKTQIIAALNDDDPQKHKWAFYLFYWKFVPKLCKRFPVAICCKKKNEEPEKQYHSSEHHPSEHHTDHIGCEPGDWHPSVITVKKLTKLICCAWDFVREQKEKAQEASGKVAEATRNLEYIKSKVKADEAALEDYIKSQLNKVECKSAPSAK